MVPVLFAVATFVIAVVAVVSLYYTLVQVPSASGPRWAMASDMAANWSALVGRL